LASQDIKQKSRKASKIQLAATVLAKGIGFLFSLVLVRLLAPEDYGHLTLALLFTNFLTIFNNFGFQTFIIRNNSKNERYLHTTFFLDLAFSAVISVILCGVAVWLVPETSEVVEDMLLLYAINIILLSLGRTHLAYQKQQLNFAVTAKADILFIVSSNLLKVLFAWWGMKSLSFPLGDIGGNILNLVFIYSVSPFRPTWSLFSKRAFRLIFWFGRNTVFTSLGSYLANQVDKIMVTSRFTTAQVGFYNFGYTQSGSVYNILIGSQTQVFLSLFGKFKNDRPELKNIILKISAGINFLVAPIFLYGVLEARPFIQILFTSKWSPAAVIFQIFCIDYFIRTFFTSITGVQISLGYADKAARTKIINSIVFVAVAATALLFQRIEIYALFYLLATVVTCLHNTHVNGKLINLTVWEFLARYRNNLILLAITAGLYFLVKWPLIQWVPAGQLSYLVVTSLVFFGIYAGLAWLFLRSVILDLTQLVFNKQRSAVNTAGGAAL
jgi:O-antigen/teichoic acid export membrane protein